MPKPKRGFICNQHRKLMYGRIQFQDGIYETDKPDEALFLENHPKYGDYICPRETAEEIDEIEAAWATWEDEPRNRPVVAVGTLEPLPTHATLGLRGTEDNRLEPDPDQYDPEPQPVNRRKRGRPKHAS